MCAVSYLNTLPLVWGMLHGAEREAVDLSFALPAVCADRLKNGQADIGLVPVGALLDQNLSIYRGAGIACRGPVRSILLISKVPFGAIRKLALDSSSRSSVLLARIILARRYGAFPDLTVCAPVMADMLEQSDACLIIGDPALLLDPAQLVESGFNVADLGAEWVEMTGLPMVFAVWAGRPDLIDERVFIASWRYGMERIEEVAAAGSAERGVTVELAREYLTRHIAFDLGEREYAGMNLYLQHAAEIVGKPVANPVSELSL